MIYVFRIVSIFNISFGTGGSNCQNGSLCPATNTHIYMVNHCASLDQSKSCDIILSFLNILSSFSLKFKHLICLIKKFSLSLRFYSDNSF